MTWDPDQYGLFADHRLRPGLELVARIPDIDPARIVDLGCGAGTLTTAIARRWPRARVSGIDGSADMLARAPASHVAWELGDIATWEPTEPIGLIYSNAALHWLDDHERLFGRLVSALEQGGVLAVQMPANWAAPTHRIPAEILDTGDYGDHAAEALLRDRVADPAEYRRWLGSAMDIDMWSTTYHQVLEGPDPVLEWVRGSVLAPVVDALDEADRERFLDECSRGYRVAYPQEPNGTTILPFTRFFIVAQRR